MASLGVLFAITRKQMDQLLAEANGPDGGGDEAVQEIVSDIEEGWDTRFLFETDKAWDAIHRCLTDDHTARGRLNPRAGEYPLNRVILGGEQLHDGEDYTVNLIRPKEVKDVANALAGITEDWMRERFFRLKPRRTLYDIDEDGFAYAWSNFQGLPEFFARAARARRAVIFTVDN